MKCPLCDFENEEGSKFCKNCYIPLSKQDYSEYNPYIRRRRKRRNKKREIKTSLLNLSHISTNGTDVPANFTRLMVILKKSGRLSEALKVSEIYDKYFYRKMT